jgi:arylsulfatase A
MRRPPRMMMATTLLLVGMAAAAFAEPAADESATTRPNIVVILCDDLGYGDLECYGHPHIKTPHLNRMADEGIRFTDFYSTAPVCSPSRVGLLTGRSPNRAGVYDWIPHGSRVHMRASEVTIPQMLKKAGYATCMSGKWHCNGKFNTQQQPQPDAAGFDHWFGTQNNASPTHENPRNFVRNGKPVGPLQGFSCQLVVDEAITWLKGHREKSPKQPFFMYVAFHEPHEPVASPKKLVNEYMDVSKNEDQAQYFANVANPNVA